MDQLRICSDFLKKAISTMLTNKLSKYITNMEIGNIQIDRQEKGGYKIHLNADICLTDNQVSQFLHIL